MHVNEQAPPYWARLFHDRGFAMYDCLRAKLVHDIDIEPWYRYNSLLYVNAAAIAALPRPIVDCLVPESQTIANVAPLHYQLRCKMISLLPRQAATALAIAKKHYTTALRGTPKSTSSSASGKSRG